MSAPTASEYVDARSQQERLQVLADLRDQEREAQRRVTEFDPSQVVLPAGAVRRSADAATRQLAIDEEIAKQRSLLATQVSEATREVVLEEQKQLKLVPRDSDPIIVSRLTQDRRTSGAVSNGPQSYLRACGYKMSIEEFHHDKGITAKDWVDYVRCQNSEDASWDDLRQYVQAALKGSASRWWMSMKDSINSWDEFVDKFLDRWENKHVDEACKNRLLLLRECDFVDMEEYIMEFTRISSQMRSEMADDDKVWFFRGGLSRALQDSVHQMVTTMKVNRQKVTFDAVVSFARAYDSRPDRKALYRPISEPNDRRPLYRPNRQRFGRNRSRSPGGETIRQNAMRERSEEGSERKGFVPFSQRECWKCGKMGHEWRKCTASAQEVNQYLASKPGGGVRRPLHRQSELKTIPSKSVSEEDREEEDVVEAVNTVSWGRKPQWSTPSGERSRASGENKRQRTGN